MRRRASGILFLAWGAIQGRSEEIAAALGGTAQCFYPPGSGRRPPVAWRYAVSTWRTVALLVRRRPAALVVTNPPVLPGLMALAWGRVSGAAVALDSHPAAFGAKANRAASTLLPVHRWLARRVDVNLVAAPAWVEVVRSWGGRAIVVHEAPASGPVSPTASCADASPSPSPKACRKFLYVGTFARDEPVEVVLDAARLVPDCEIAVTGEVSGMSDDLRMRQPGNVRLAGFLDPPAYRRAVEDADAVVVLSTEPNSVMRAAYEAVYAERPLLVSDWPVLRQVFPDAVHAANTPQDLADGLRRVIEGYAALAARAPAARQRQQQRWEHQRQVLAAALGVAPISSAQPLGSMGSAGSVVAPVDPVAPSARSSKGTIGPDRQVPRAAAHEVRA